MKFRKKPVVIEAVQWTGKNKQKILSFIGTAGCYRPEGIFIQTLEGEHFANVGDWIIKGVKGEFYPCKPDIFTQTYEQVSEKEVSKNPNEIDPKVIKDFNKIYDETTY